MSGSTLETPDSVWCDTDPPTHLTQGSSDFTKGHRSVGKPTAVTLLMCAFGIALGAAVIMYLCIWGTKFGLDLQVYRDGSRAWIEGGDPYLHRYTPVHLNYTYPPFALLVLGWLDLLAFKESLILWWFLSLGALWASLYIFGRWHGWHMRYRWAGLSLVLALASVLVLEPVRSTFDYGQVNLVLMCLVVIDTMMISNTSRYRGLLVGVAAAIKLVPLVFVLFFVVQRDRKSAVRSVLTFGLLQGTVWVLSPSTSAKYWFHVLWEPGRIGTIAYAGNQSWYALLHRPPFSGASWLSVLLWLVFVACTLFFSLSISYRSLSVGRRDAAVLSLALCGLLISPISWSHHWVWAVLLPSLLFMRTHRRRSHVMRWMVVALLGITVAAPYWWGLHGWAGITANDALVVVTFALLVTWWIDTRAVAHESNKLSESGSSLGRARASGHPAEVVWVALDRQDQRTCDRGQSMRAGKIGARSPPLGRLGTFGSRARGSGAAGSSGRRRPGG